MMKINFYNIYKQDRKIQSKIFNNIKKIFKKGDFILGKDVGNFENKFSKSVNSKFAIGCANGTDAITLALRSLNLKKGSEVIIPAMTYCSTAFAVLNAGLIPKLVDIEKNSPLININKIKNAVTKKTKVIIPVHLYGSVVDIIKIKKIIRSFKRKIFIIDDCAQAHGAFCDKNRKKVGSLSDISTFSFYPGKNLGAYGDAGIITTNNKRYYKIIKKLTNLGSDKKYIHDLVGQNSRLDTIQASILVKKLNLLNSLNNKRRKIAKYYDKNIINKKIVKLNYTNQASYHQYVIISKQRNKLTKYLKKKNIGFGFHYPYSINKLHSLKNLFKNQKYKNAEYLANYGISLPIDPSLNTKEIEYIVKTLNSNW